VRINGTVKSKCVTDCEIFEATVLPSGYLCGHGAQVHGLLYDIAVAGDLLWIYGFEEEGIIVFSMSESARP
jgi:hypothetical protein